MIAARGSAKAASITHRKQRFKLKLLRVGFELSSMTH
jgi:hypothetical protein